MVCNEALDHRERVEGSQLNSSFNLSHPKISSHEEGWCVPVSTGENNDISVEAYKEGEVLNSEILNEIVDISFEKNHDSSFQSSFEDQFDSMQEELLFEHPFNGKQMIEYFEICHAFYDLVAEYMDKFFLQKAIKPSKKPPKGLKCLQKAKKPPFFLQKCPKFL